MNTLRLDQILNDTQFVKDKLRNSSEYAMNMYRAFCNNEWYEISNTKNVWSCSWRYSARLVAQLRGVGDYMDWYCCEDEGVVSEEILFDINSIGWNIMPAIDFESSDWCHADETKHAYAIDLKPMTPDRGAFRIAIVGGAGSGKDTACELISLTFPDVFRIAFADDLKRMSSEMVNRFAQYHFLTDLYFPEFSLEEINKHRDILRPMWQWLGTDIVRARYPNYWINRVAMRLNNNSFLNRVIITDCRFPNEAEWARRNGFVIVRLYGRSRDLEMHESEQHVHKITADLEFDNSGTMDELHSWIKHTVIPFAMQNRT